MKEKNYAEENHKAATLRETLTKNPEVSYKEVSKQFEKLGATVTQAQFYSIRTAMRSDPYDTPAKTAKNSKKAKRKKVVVAAKTKAPAVRCPETGTAAIAFRDDLFRLVTKAQKDLGKETVHAATQSVFDQLG